DAAFLFSSDEEATDPRCIAAFLAGDHGFRQVLVAEPTGCEAVLAHRGIAAVQLRFHGEAGHASGAQALSPTAVHKAMRCGVDALALAEGEAHQRFGGLTGLRLTIARVEGGITANVLAPAAAARLASRPRPSPDV